MEQLRERRDDLLAWHPDRKLAPDGETIREFAVRVMAATDEIVARHLDQRVVVASISELIHWPHGRITGGAARYIDRDWSALKFLRRRR